MQVATDCSIEMYHKVNVLLRVNLLYFNANLIGKDPQLYYLVC